MKTLISNWRELLIGVLLFLLVTGLLLLMGSDSVADNPPLSIALSGLLALFMGVLKFAVACALAWFGLAFTFPEANRFIVSSDFDRYWHDMLPWRKAQIALAAVAVLAIVAGLCMSS